MSFCMMRNFGIAKNMRKPTTTNRHTTASTMIQLIAALVVDTMMMPPMARMGA